MKKLIADGVELTLSSRVGRVDLRSTVSGKPFAPTFVGAGSSGSGEVIVGWTLASGFEWRYTYALGWTDAEILNLENSLLHFPADPIAGLAGGWAYNFLVRARCTAKLPP